jgi:ferredoxin
MLFSILIYLWVAITCCWSYKNVELFYGFRRKSLHRTHMSVPDWLQGSEGPNAEQIPSTITVRFINTVNGKDVVVDDVPMGSNLLAVGDKAGVKLPRACRTGLCGSCTCDVKDPLAIATPTNSRDGFATIRACSTKCFVPDGLEEMVVDVHRMQRKPKQSAVIGRDSTSLPIEDSINVMYYSIEK